MDASKAHHRRSPRPPGHPSTVKVGRHRADDRLTHLPHRASCRCHAEREADRRRLRAGPYSVGQVRRRAIGIGDDALDRAHAGIFLRVFQRLPCGLHPLGNLRHHALGAGFLTERSHTLNFLGHDGVVDFKVRNAKHPHRAAGLRHGMAGAAARCRTNQRQDIVLFLDSHHGLRDGCLGENAPVADEAGDEL